MVVTLGQQYNVGEKPTAILYTYINRQAGPPNKTKQKAMYYRTVKQTAIHLLYSCYKTVTQLLYNCYTTVIQLLSTPVARVVYV